jgi:hypothetical protein
LRNITKDNYEYVFNNDGNGDIVYLAAKGTDIKIPVSNRPQTYEEMRGIILYQLKNISR